MGFGADTGVHPGDVIQGGVEEEASDSELAVDGAAAEGQICGRANCPQFRPLPRSPPSQPRLPPLPTPS